jgi:hypothetical protein
VLVNQWHPFWAVACTFAFQSLEGECAMKDTCITENQQEPKYFLVWIGLWIAALAVLLLLPALGQS